MLAQNWDFVKPYHQDWIPPLPFFLSRPYNARLMDSEIRSKILPGARVKVIQQIAARNHTWTTEVRGVIVDYAQKETGSWYAHSRDDKLWLDRLVIKKDTTARSRR